MTTLDPAVQAQLQQIASGGLPPQTANALLQAGKINYGQYQQATGMVMPGAPAAPATVAAPAPAWTPPAAELPVESNADPATANMSPDQIAALDRSREPASTAVAAPAPAPGPPAGGISFHPAPSQPGDPGAPPAAGGLNLAGLVAPGGAVPAAWVPRGRETSTQSGVAFSPETQAALQKFGQAGDQLDDATRQSIDTQQRQDAQAARVNADQAQADLASFQNRKAKQDSDRAWSWNQIASAQRDVEAAQAKGIDPHHWWNEKSTGSKIMMGIGMIAAGFNQGTGHATTNGVLDTINKEIDRDVDAQKENAAGKDKSLQNKMALYGLLRQKGLDEDASADGAKLLAHQNLDAQLKAAQADAQSPLGKMQLAKAIQDNQQKIATIRAGFDEKAANKSSSSQSEAFRPATAGVAAVTPQAILKSAQAIYEKNLGKPGNDWNQAVRLAVRGATGKDVMPGAAEPIITESPKGGTGRMGLPLSNRMANVQALDELAKLAGGTFASPGEAARANQLLATLKANGVAGLPESIGSVNMGGITGSTAAAIDQARKSERERVNALRSVIAGGGGGGDEGDGEAATPAGFQGDE